jgi:outer membrane receptor protein involved in Fe transport
MLQTFVSFFVRVSRCLDAFCRAALLLALVGVVAAAQTASAPSKRLFQLATGDASVTLRQFAEQSGEQVIFLVPKVKGVTTNPIRGEFTARDALDRMVANTELTVVQDNKTGALMVQRTPKRPSPTTPPAQQTTPPTSNSTTQIMNRSNPFTRLASWVALALAAPAVAQTAVPAAGTSPKDEVVELSPFVIKADSGWIAGTSLTGTRTNKEIQDLPISVEAITSDFMRDLNAFTLEDAGMFVANMIVTDYLDGRTFDQQRYTFRGLEVEGDGGSSRNFFRWYAPTDNYNIERIDFNKGSNSLMFGDAAPGGRASTYTKRALFKNFHQITGVYGSYESHRVMLDVNRKLTDQLALRFNYVNRFDGTYIDDVGGTLRAAHLTGTYQPFRNTQLRVEVERGDAYRTRGNNQVTVREIGAPGLGLNRANTWTITADGTIYNRTPAFTTVHPNPSARDQVAGSGRTLTNLEGMTAVVPVTTTASPTSTALITTGQTIQLPGPARSVALGNGGSDDSIRPYRNLSIWLLQNVGSFGVELAYNRQYNNEKRNDSASFVVSVDGNGRPFFDRSYDMKEYYWDTDTVRATVTRPLELGKWGKQYLVATAEHQQELTGAFVSALANYAPIDSGAATNIRNHVVFFRAYLDDPGFGTADYWKPLLPQNLPQTSTFRADWFNNKGTSPTQYKYQRTYSFSSSGTYFDNRLHSMLGARYDRFRRKYIPGSMPTDAIGQFVFPGYADEAPEAYEYDPLSDLSNWTYSAGLNYYVLPNVNIYGQYSTSYIWQGVKLFDNTNPGPMLGENHEVGFKGSLLDKQLFFTLGAYRTYRENAVFRWTTGPLGPELEDLFNPNDLPPSDPKYFRAPPENRGGEQRATLANEQSEGFEFTLQTRRIFGVQARVSLSKTRVTAQRDFTKFKEYLDAAVERTNRALAPGGDPLMAEDLDDLANAVNVYESNSEAAPLLGNRTTPYAFNWLLDYEFADSTFLRHTRVAVYGNWRDDYNMSNLGGVIYQDGAMHPISGYIIHHRRILGRSTSFRLGVKNIADLENRGRLRRSAVIGTLADGTTINQFRYTTPTSWDFSMTVDF